MPPTLTESFHILQQLAAQSPGLDYANRVKAMQAVEVVFGAIKYKLPKEQPAAAPDAGKPTKR